MWSLEADTKLFIRQVLQDEKKNTFNTQADRAKEEAKLHFRCGKASCEEAKRVLRNRKLKIPSTRNGKEYPQASIRKLLTLGKLKQIKLHF